ncbi:MAG: hypothetical protein WB565_01180, partial [Acidimicrobiales bacterium]
MGWAGSRFAASRPKRVYTLASVAVLCAVVPTLAGVADPAHAAAPSPQIPGSVAAPAASEVSPICDAPDPSGVLGPESSLPSDPTTTVGT